MRRPPAVRDLKRHGRHLLRQAVKVTAAASDGVRRPRRGLVALLYHRIGTGSGLELDLPASLFDEQMAALEANHRVLAYDDAIRGLTTLAPATAPDAVTVTFDDGTADFVDTALPILVAHRVPSVLFVATAFVEDHRPFPRGGVPVSWSGLADALTTGLVTIGSHTHGHVLLDRLPGREVAAELDRSIALVEDRLGVTPHHFAYPKALPGGPAAAGEVRRRFLSAALAGTRSNPYGATDPYRIWRSPIQASDGMRWFGRKLAGGMALEDELRQVLNRRRYAGLTT